jgi:hypothetical protein
MSLKKPRVFRSGRLVAGSTSDTRSEHVGPTTGFLAMVGSSSQPPPSVSVGGGAAVVAALLNRVGRLEEETEVQTEVPEEKAGGCQDVEVRRGVLRRPAATTNMPLRQRRILSLSLARSLALALALALALSRARVAHRNSGRRRAHGKAGGAAGSELPAGDGDGDGSQAKAK